MATIQVQGKQLEYFEAGLGDNVVVLIHGAGSSALIWDTVQSQMAAEGYHVYAISLPGAGQSHRPIEPAAYQPASYARDIKGALHALEIKRFAIVGHSLGVSNVLYLAADYCEGFDIRAMILMAGGGGGQRQAPSVEEADAIRKNWPHPDPAGEDERRRVWEKLHMGLSEDVRDQLWRDINNNPFERAFGQRISPRKDMRAFLNNTDIPTLIVSGDSDSVVPLKLTLQMYPELPREKRHLHVFHGIDHYPNAEVPDEISRVYMEFLDDKYGSAAVE